MEKFNLRRARAIPPIYAAAAALQIECREKWMRIWPLGAERRGRRCIKFNLAARAHTYIVK
jgi:hypothetical protein